MAGLLPCEAGQMLRCLLDEDEKELLKLVFDVMMTRKRYQKWLAKMLYKCLLFPAPPSAASVSPSFLRCHHPSSVSLISKQWQ